MILFSRTIRKTVLYKENKRRRECITKRTRANNLQREQEKNLQSEKEPILYKEKKRIREFFMNSVREESFFILMRC